MKYTQAEETKLGQLRDALAKARAHTKVLAKRKREAGKPQLEKLRRFRTERRALERKLRVEESKRDKKDRELARALDKAIRIPSNKYWASTNAAQRIYDQIGNLEYAARVRDEEAQRKAPLNKSELALIVKRLQDNGCPVTDGKTIIFKRVSKDLKTRIGYDGETTYSIGKAVTVPNWDPRREECGAGKFHACFNPKACDSYGYHGPDDKYIAIEVAVKDMYAWPTERMRHPTKIAFRRGKVLYVCNANGKKVSRGRKEQAVY